MTVPELADQKTRQAWDDADGYVCAMYEAPNHPDDHAYDTGHVRIVEHPDEICRVEDLFGDTYTPECHPEIDPEIIERERQEEVERAERDGVWGYVAEYWNGDQWEHADSIWGFISDDFKNSGYDTDLMQAALDSLATHHESMARNLEATRPDMYEGPGS